MSNKCILNLCLVWLAWSIGTAHADICRDLGLRSGDVIFQTSKSQQSNAIMWASKSFYSHVGLIEENAGTCHVLEAINNVSKTPLEEWVARGRFARFSVFRDPQVSSELAEKIIATTRS